VLNKLNQVLSAQTPPRRQPCFRVVPFVEVPVIMLAVSRRMRDSIRAPPSGVNVLPAIMLA
jgi:hypothetical protein